MADNVLGTLFQDIADAIRAKTGGTDTMVPASFPEEILSIVTGGGGEGGSIEFVAASGTFTPDAQYATIQHDLGVVPDYFELRLNVQIGGEDVTISSGAVIAAVSGVSASFKELTGAYIGILVAASSTGRLTFWPANEIDASSSIFGGLKKANASTIEVGTTSATGLQPGLEYTWQAFGRKA